MHCHFEKLKEFLHLKMTLVLQKSSISQMSRLSSKIAFIFQLVFHDGTFNFEGLLLGIKNYKTTSKPWYLHNAMLLSQSRQHQCFGLGIHYFFHTSILSYVNAIFEKVSYFTMALQFPDFCNSLLPKLPGDIVQLLYPLCLNLHFFLSIMKYRTEQIHVFKTMVKQKQDDN